MLSALKIQNYALIQNLDIEIKPGLNIITGETGTGKSILLGALGLILGSRADTSSLLKPENKCVVEGRFSLAEYNFKEFFLNNDLDYDDQSILRREISPNGKSRAFINDTPVNLNILKEFGEMLVDIHSQHQTLKLSNPLFQVSLLDAYAGHKAQLEQYSEKFKAARKLERDLNLLREKEALAKKESDFNIYQLNELDQARVLPDELINLEEEQLLLGNAETIKTTLQAANYDLTGDESGVINRLALLRKQFSSVADFNPKLQQIFNRIEALLIELKDVNGDIDEFQDSVTLDSERLDKVNSRIESLNHLLYKHQLKTESELIELAETLRAKIEAAESLSSIIDAKNIQLASLLAESDRLAETISQNRKKQIPGLEENLTLLLKEAGIPEAVVKIELTASSSLSETGKDNIRILFSANKGSRPMPVGDIASGGELSRLMLCFKYILADTILLPTIIFDEIDTGISGETARKVGQMIKKLSSAHQVICITHLPQVAATGDYHYIVYKTVDKDKTVTNIRRLDVGERVEEIAKMIAGHKPSTIAIENAKELLAFNRVQV
jgi:DNA repair protein RecN (Recombination protein N)